MFQLVLDLAALVELGVAEGVVVGGAVSADAGAAVAVADGRDKELFLAQKLVLVDLVRGGDAGAEGDGLVVFLAVQGA